MNPDHHSGLCDCTNVSNDRQRRLVVAFDGTLNVLESACVSFVVQKRGIDREGWGRRKDGATERENESD